MGRLRQLRPALDRAPSRLGFLEPETDRRLQSRNPLRHLYGTAAWRALSWRVRVEDGFNCRRCGKVEGRKGQTVADHIRRPEGDERLFWDRANLQCLCKPCHDRVKQAEEARAARRAGGGGGV